MSRLISTILVLIFCASTASINLDRYFQNPGGTNGCYSRSRKQGHCIPLTNCPYLKKILDHNVHKQIFVNEYVCGYASVMYVCCPDNQSEEIRNNLPKKEAIQPKIQANENITNHKNRQLFPNSCGLEIVSKIMGGKESSIGESPWMALLRTRKKNGHMSYRCGGVLISSRYILTAAHCLKNTTMKIIDQIRLGEHNQNTAFDCDRKKCNNPPVNIAVEELIRHPGFNTNTNANDIGLIRLKTHVKRGLFIQPICLPFDDLSQKNLDGLKLWTAGWGKTTNGDDDENSPVKKKLEMPVVPLKKCKSYYSDHGVEITDKQICAGGRQNEDSCQGDSGGPLMRKETIKLRSLWFVYGIVSYGVKTCGTADKPGIYTRVGKYLKWILDNVRE